MESLVSLSTFSSEETLLEPSGGGPGGKESVRKPSVELIFIYVGTLVLLVAGLCLVNRYESDRFLPLAVTAQPAPALEFYLAYFHGGVENYVIYDNVYGAANELKRADVLFLGNSRMLYAMRDQEALKRYFSARHLRYYTLAFAYGEGDRFPEAIIRKYDLHPKWVVVNADPFFGAATSPLASKVMSGGSFDVFKFRFETNLSFDVQRKLHQVLPYLGLSKWNEEPDWVYYRSKLDGTIRLAAYKGKSGSAERSAEAAPQVPLLDQIDEGRRFHEELRARGAKLVLTSVPPSPDASANLLGSSLGVPVIDCSAKGLSTFDGSHLDAASTRQFITTLLRGLDGIMNERSQLYATNETAGPAALP
jgi:hypothetical protein